jgi:hypothetical protein
MSILALNSLTNSLKAKCITLVDLTGGQQTSKDHKHFTSVKGINSCNIPNPNCLNLKEFAICWMNLEVVRLFRSWCKCTTPKIQKLEGSRNSLNPTTGLLGIKENLNWSIWKRSTKCQLSTSLTWTTNYARITWCSTCIKQLRAQLYCASIMEASVPREIIRTWLVWTTTASGTPKWNKLYNLWIRWLKPFGANRKR